LPLGQCKQKKRLILWVKCQTIKLTKGTKAASEFRLGKVGG